MTERRSIDRRQHKVDSFLETATSTVVGFIVAMFTYQFIINPIYGFHSGVGESAGVTSIFMVASILRQYVIRRIFNGKTIYEGLRSYFSKGRKS
jgi:hypothetical protein